ncbi:MAG TPA: hypothetical protein VK518_22415 [Puia sp.]|nr:hypothetical protein [Puia sp.]
MNNKNLLKKEVKKNTIKWANISFLDNDKWPVTGWVLKKHLTASNSY